MTPHWDLDALARPPKIFPAPGLEADGVRALFYEGLPWKGRPTRVFAYVGLPPLGPGAKAPGMVLVHGGGGTAFPDWVRLWTARGYAAIAMDTCGCTAGGEHMNRPRHEHAGPPGWGGYDQLDQPLEDQWMHHAVADVLLARAVLAALPEVHADRIGLTGISWGGILACIVAGLEPRFRFTAPVYGCGFLDQGRLGADLSNRIGPDAARRWLDLWDPAHWLAGARRPMLWVNGTNDTAFSLPAMQKSYRLAPGERALAVRVRMVHAHGGPGESPPEIHRFAEQHLCGGRPLTRITDAGLDGRRAWAQFQADGPVRWAELAVTTDAGPWAERLWQLLPARLDADAGRADADLPDAATAFFLNITDDRGCVTSTEHVTLDAPRPSL
jgi:dienelactone hydrolase